MAGQTLPVIALVAMAVCATVAEAAAAKVPAMYVFGDSTADVGNNNYLPGAAVPRANFPHNGIDFPTSRPTGRFSNGYNGVDFLGQLRYCASFVNVLELGASLLVLALHFCDPMTEG
uniref:GDSL esterase/lipase n=1 Tax=Oryza brachyantha TaxID=4533 RepID=J3LFP6_ORYBR